MAKLEPLVAAKDVSTALHRREITDVLSDTFVDQGRPILARPPSKWKVMTLTIIALFLTAWPVAKEMPRQYVRWGVTDGYGNRDVPFTVWLLVRYLGWCYYLFEFLVVRVLLCYSH